MKSSSLWLRSLAAIIDSALVSILWYFVINTWGTVSGGSFTLSGTPALLLMMGTAAYWIVPEWLTGATFGKWSCDLRVVDVQGIGISLSQAVKRNVLRLLDFFPWYLTGFIAAKFTPQNQRLGDLWAKTLVVSCSEIRRHGSAATPSVASE